MLRTPFQLGDPKAMPFGTRLRPGFAKNRSPNGFLNARRLLKVQVLCMIENEKKTIPKNSLFHLVRIRGLDPPPSCPD